MTDMQAPSFCLFFIAAAAQAAWGETIYRIDVSSGREIAPVLSAAPVFNQLTWGTVGESYYAADGLRVKERQFVFEVKVPQHGIIKLRSNLATIKTKEGLITSLTFQSGIMPMGEAHQAALTISKAMNLQTERIAEWYQKASTPAGATSCFLISRSYPEIEIQIRSSINNVYPYRLTAAVYWSDDLGGEKALPPPFPQPLTLTLDPPSGKVYDPAEMWGTAEERKEQERFGNEWVLKNPEAARKMVINTYGKDHPKVKELEATLAGNQANPSPRPPTTATQVAPTTSYHWLWIAGGAILVLAFLAMLKRRSS